MRATLNESMNEPKDNFAPNLDLKDLPVNFDWKNATSPVKD